MDKMVVFHYPTIHHPEPQAPAACGFRLEQLARQLERKTPLGRTGVETSN